MEERLRSDWHDLTLVFKFELTEKNSRTLSLVFSVVKRASERNPEQIPQLHVPAHFINHTFALLHTHTSTKRVSFQRGIFGCPQEYDTQDQGVPS